MKEQIDKKIKLSKPPAEPKPPKDANSSLSNLCDICGEIFKNHRIMSDHKKTKHVEAEKCPHCPQPSSHHYSQHNLKRHIKNMHTDKKFICDTCEKRFGTKSDLIKHTKTVHARNKRTQRNHVCGKCNKAFTVVKSLIIHERSAHTGNKVNCILLYKGLK